MASRDNKRALTIIRKLRARQQKQENQIDMLCRDMVSAHHEFSTKLAKLTFVTSYYQSLLQSSDLEGVLDAAVWGIREEIEELRDFEGYAAIDLGTSNSTVALYHLRRDAVSGMDAARRRLGPPGACRRAALAALELALRPPAAPSESSR